MPPPDIKLTNLSYSHPTVPPTPALHDLSLHLPAQSRTLLIGANGAGKTTLLRLLSGKKLAPPDRILVASIDPFRFGLETVTYLGLEWILNPIVRNDIEVWRLLDSVGGLHYKSRRDELVGILDVDEDWRMHLVSDGERRRVQLCMGLIRPWDVLLLDEVTVDLDVLARGRFLNWLKGETEGRGCTIVYATHIMDGLAGWPTHVIRMTAGEVRWFGTTGQEGVVSRKGVFRNSELLDLVLLWLEEDLKERGPRGTPKRDGK
ncbi:P-loop containing nucleoside triphosphate hydrolase protein [Peziza echinospora]|nr:P-loop containing nucleoside triphosphate hydrolase protein [Peziza echinospora]